MVISLEPVLPTTFSQLLNHSFTPFSEFTTHIRNTEAY